VTLGKAFLIDRAKRLDTSMWSSTMHIGIIASMNRWAIVGVVVIAMAGACSSGKGGGQTGGQSGGHGGSTGGMGGTGGVGGSGPGGTGGAGAGGTAGTGTVGAGGAGGIADSCLGLRVDSPPQVLYTPPTNATAWQFAGSDNQGALLAVDVNSSVRLVSASWTGSVEVLLDETTYRPTWGFDWRSAVALRRSDGVDLLVSDRYSVALVHRRGSTVSVVTLAESEHGDLTAMALTLGSSGTLAMFGRGDDVAGSPGAVIAVDVDPFLAMVNPYPSIAKQISAMPQAARTFTPTAGANAIATPTAIWLTTERLDPVAACHDTGQTEFCGGGKPAVSLLDCTWYLDIFRLTKGADLQAAALATLTGHAFVQPECGATRSVDPHDIMKNLGMGWGMSNNHGAGVDLVTSQLGVVLNYHTSLTTFGLQFALIDPSGHLSIDGVTQIFSSPNTSTTNSFAWTGVRSGHVFYCSGELPADCWVADSAAVSMFELDVGVPRGTVRLPDGFGLIESMNNPDTSAWVQPLTCVH
jgi:hypothetical protein